MIQAFGRFHWGCFAQIIYLLNPINLVYLKRNWLLTCNKLFHPVSSISNFIWIQADHTAGFKKNVNFWLLLETDTNDFTTAVDCFTHRRTHLYRTRKQTQTRPQSLYSILITTNTPTSLTTRTKAPPVIDDGATAITVSTSCTVKPFESRDKPTSLLWFISI